MIYNINNDEINKECLICLEFDNNKNNKLIRLEKLNGYEKKCSCAALVHDKCLYDWYNFKTVCPICRSRVHKKLNLTEKLKNKIKNIYSKRHKVLLYILRVGYNTLYILFIMIVIFICAEIYIRIYENISLRSGSEYKNETDDICNIN